jgi:hypothetical protein
MLSGEVEGEERGEDQDAQELDIPVIADGTPWQFSVLFCGIGDARHFFGTLLDLGYQCSPRQGRPKPDISNVKTHMTLVNGLLCLPLWFLLIVMDRS